MSSQVKRLEGILTAGDPVPAKEWNLRVVQSEECQSYIAWNERTREALAIDPKLEDWEAYLSLVRELNGYVWLGVIDTHTHADHISVAARLATELSAPLIMHEKAPSRRVQLRSSGVSRLPSQASPVQLIPTPGHTQDSISVLWGPYLFGGDTVLYGDTGRDDLPGGDPTSHYESLQAIKVAVRPETIVLPGHDHKGGRASSWGTQLKVNASLTQSKSDFVREAAAFDVPAPKLLKESLRENFK